MKLQLTEFKIFTYIIQDTGRFGQRSKESRQLDVFRFLEERSEQ